LIHLKTNFQTSQIVYHYQIALHISDDSDHASGRIAFTLSTTYLNKPKELKFERNVSRLKPANIHTLLVTFNFTFSKIKNVQIEWKRRNEALTLQGGKVFKIDFIEINYMSHVNQRYSLN